MRKKDLSSWSRQIFSRHYLFLSTSFLYILRFYKWAAFSNVFNAERTLAWGNHWRLLLPLYMWKTWSYLKMEERSHVNSSHTSISLCTRKVNLRGKSKSPDITGCVSHPRNTPLWQKRARAVHWDFLYISHSSKLSAVLENSLFSNSAWNIIWIFSENAECYRAGTCLLTSKAKQAWLKISSSKQIGEELHCWRH